MTLSVRAVHEPRSSSRALPSSQRDRRRSLAFVGALALLAVAISVLATGCGDDEISLDSSTSPPTTEIVSPILSGQTVAYTLDVSWRGADPDGALHGFEFAIDDTAAWTFTPEFRSVLEFGSPVCCVSDTIVLPDSTVVIDSLAYGMHTLFVRAVDNGGEVDPTPARISFNATTVTPEATIIRGPSPTSEIEMAPRHVAFEWEGSDPDGEIDGYRYRLDDGPWVAVPADCTHVRFAGLAVAGYTGDPNGVHEFALLAVDNAGATERSVDRPANYRKWIANADVSWARLCITEELLGTWCDSDSILSVVPSGAPLSFRWVGDASAYGSQVVCYAYSLDGSPFSECAAELTRFPFDERSFVPLPGTHQLVVKARDDVGEMFETRLRFTVVDYCFNAGGIDPGELPVLYIDDFALGTGTDGALFPEDPKEEAFWDSLLTGFAYVKFDAEAGRDIPTPRIMGQASTVIWYVDDASWLKQGMLNPLERYKLRSVLLCGTNLILCGSIPSSAFAPDNSFDPALVGDPGCPHMPLFTYGGPEHSLEWFPASCDDRNHFAYEILGLSKSYYSGSQDDLRALVSDGRPLPDGLPVPDLVIDTGKRGTRPDGTQIFEVLGLELCEQYDLSGKGSPIPLWRFRDSDGDVKRVCGYYLPKQGARGHIVVLGFSPYFFDTLQMQELFRRLLIMFGENYYPPY